MTMTSEVIDTLGVIVGRVLLVCRG